MLIAEMSSEAKRTDYLRGIASGVTSINVNANKARHAILDAAFTQVAHPVDWKKPINVVMTFHENDSSASLGTYMDAIEYFVGTRPATFIVSQEIDGKGKQINTFRIVSEGFYLTGA